MRVRLLNNQFYEVEENDVAYLFKQTRLPCAAIYSDSIFTLFEAYMKRHSLDYDPEPIDEWDGNFIDQFTSITTLRHLVTLAKRTSQAALLELCQQRIAQLQVRDSDSNTDSDGDDNDHSNNDGGNSGGDDSDGRHSDQNDDDDGNSGEDDSDGIDSDHSDDAGDGDDGNSDEDDSDGDDSDHSDDDDESNSGNVSDEVDAMGNQVEDLSDQELSVGGSDDASNRSLEVSSGSSKDTNDLTPEVVSDDSGSGKVDNMDSRKDLSLGLANSADCEASVVKRDL